MCISDITNYCEFYLFMAERHAWCPHVYSWLKGMHVVPMFIHGWKACMLSPCLFMAERHACCPHVYSWLKGMHVVPMFIHGWKACLLSPCLFMAERHACCPHVYSWLKGMHVVPMFIHGWKACMLSPCLFMAERHVYCCFNTFMVSYLHFYCNSLDETSILVAVHFSLMKNIYQSCDLDRAMGWSKVDVSQ